MASSSIFCGIVGTKALVSLLFLSIVLAAVLPSGQSHSFDLDTEIDYNNNEVIESKQFFGLLSGTASGIEVFDLIESFIRLKGELFAKLKRLFDENAVLLKSFLRVLIDNFEKLNDFTLSGLRIFRKIFEFAFGLLKQWNGSGSHADDVDDGPGISLPVNGGVKKPLLSLASGAIGGILDAGNDVKGTAVQTGLNLNDLIRGKRPVRHDYDAEDDAFVKDDDMDSFLTGNDYVDY